MTGFSVDHDELMRAASDLRAIHAELVGAVGLRYEMTPVQVGHAELATAVAEFQQSSRSATACVFADIAAAADRLSLNAGHYQQAQEQIEASLDSQTVSR